MTLPPLPVYPGADAGAAALAQFDAELALYRAAASAIHGQAQADTAVAMAQAAEAQRYMADKLAEPVPVRKPTRAELVWDMVKVQPQASILTPGQIVSGAAQIVDAYIKAFPAAVEG